MRIIQMENKPEYRFTCEIRDLTTDELIIKGSCPLSETTSELGDNEFVDLEVGSMMRAFAGKFKAKYEKENYQDEIQEDTTSMEEKLEAVEDTFTSPEDGETSDPDRTKYPK